MPICRRSKSWVTPRTSWPSMRIAPALGVEEAQEQVDQRRLAGARAADEPDLLAGPDRQRHVAQPARAAAVVVADPVEGDLAPRHRELARARRRPERIGWAIVSMPSRITPRFWKSEDSDHMIQPVIAFSRSTSAEAAATVPIVAAPAPEHQRVADHRDDQEAVDHGQPEVHQRDDPHLRHEGLARMLDRLAGVVLLRAGMGEELHRLDVGVAVDDPPGDRRAGVRELLRRLADARDRPADQPEVEPQPDQERHRQPPVGPRQQPQRAREVDRRRRPSRRRSGRSPRRPPVPSASSGWRSGRRSRSGTSPPTARARAGASASARWCRRSASATG